MVNWRMRTPFVIGMAVAAVLAGPAAAQTTDPPVPPPKPPVPPVPPVPTVPELPTLPQVPDVPEVPQDPQELADLATPLSARMLLMSHPSGARAAPVTFRLDGWLRPPMRLDRVSGFFQRTFGLDLGLCGGRVTMTFKTGGRTVASRRASVTESCAFRSQFTVRARRSVGPRGRLRVTARFAGNDMLGPAHHSIVLRVR
jgi:hypothetical protein